MGYKASSLGVLSACRPSLDHLPCTCFVHNTVRAADACFGLAFRVICLYYWGYWIKRGFLSIPLIGVAGILGKEKKEDVEEHLE